MSCITRCVMRWGLIGVLGLGGLSLLVGPERVAAGLAQIRTQAQGVIDECVDDPVALRRQLEQLAEQYPDRIAEVRGEIAEVDHQIAQLDRDVEIAARVVAYTSEDLSSLKGKIETAMAEASSTTRPVFIRFEGIRFDIEDARQEALRIGKVRQNYRDRMAFDTQQAKLLGEQKSRLSEILNKLDDDFNTYQSQLWSLDRQIDAIQRNDRLIALMEDQQETLSSYDRYERVGNLKQLESKLVELRTIQDAQLEVLEKAGLRDNYEDKARLDLENNTDVEVLYDELMQEFSGQEAEQTKSGSVAWADPIIIE